MRRIRLSISAAALLGVGILIASQGCSLVEGHDATTVERLCTPGAYVLCHCANSAKGTKLCKDDGQSFEECTTSASGDCIGGEVDGPETNAPISDGIDGSRSSTNAIDTCPGKPTAVQPNVNVELDGDTRKATTDRKGKEGSCAVGGGAHDHVYSVVPSGTGTLDVTVQGADGLHPIAYVRTSCSDEASQVSCAPESPNQIAQLKAKVVSGREYALVIDGASGSAGTYVATLKLTTGTFCGDGEITQGEACDDGNNADDDGCSSDCLEVSGNPTSGGGCSPGHPVHLWPNETVTGNGSNATYGNAWSAPSAACDPTGSNGFSDHVYAVTPHESGTMTVSVKPSNGKLNLMLSARRTCDASSSTTEAMCKNDLGVSSNAETLTLRVTKDRTLYVAVDGGGFSSNKGDYAIQFSLAP